LVKIFCREVEKNAKRIFPQRRFIRRKIDFAHPSFMSINFKEKCLPWIDAKYPEL
jgi:hypothetical protein